MMNEWCVLLLVGVKVFDFLCVLVGLWCVMVLVDFGVEVIKVEYLVCGDDMCDWGLWIGDIEIMYFNSVNCSKWLICVDL